LEKNGQSFTFLKLLSGVVAHVSEGWVFLLWDISVRCSVILLHCMGNDPHKTSTTALASSDLSLEV
jgi:hypothetical protein